MDTTNEVNTAPETPKFEITMEYNKQSFDMQNNGGPGMTLCHSGQAIQGIKLHKREADILRHPDYNIGCICGM